MRDGLVCLEKSACSLEENASLEGSFLRASRKVRWFGGHNVFVGRIRPEKRKRKGVRDAEETPDESDLLTLCGRVGSWGVEECWPAPSSRSISVAQRMGDQH